MVVGDEEMKILFIYLHAIPKTGLSFLSSSIFVTQMKVFFFGKFHSIQSTKQPSNLNDDALKSAGIFKVHIFYRWN